MSIALRRLLAVTSFLSLPLFGCTSSHMDPGPGIDAGFVIRFDAELPPEGSMPGIDAGSDAGIGPPIMGATGSACIDDSDCEGGSCISIPGLTPGGYCTQPCTGDEPCPSGSECVTLDMRTGTSYCLDSCEPGSPDRQCRAGYGCASSPLIGVAVCVAGCEDATDCMVGECDPTGGDLGSGICFTPGAMIGSMCTVEASCPSGGSCFSEEDTGWPGGACVSGGCDPTSGAGCDGDAVCVPNGRFGVCVDGCAVDADCRSGYRCRSDSTFPARRYCSPGCTMDAQCSDGRVCNMALGQCLPPFVPSELGDACSSDPSLCAGGICLSEGETGYPNSYCVSAGCTPGAMPSGCPSDGVCRANRDGSAYCFDGCTASTECRAGYTCRPVDAADPMSPLACMPGCSADAQCANPGFVCNDGTGLCLRTFSTMSLGDACIDRRACRGGLCITEAADGWPGGACTFPGCRLSGMGPSEMCPTGSACIDDERGDPEIGVCAISCTVGMTGICRTGYACVELVAGMPEGTCQPACTAATDCVSGRTCDMMTGLCVSAPTP